MIQLPIVRALGAMMLATLGVVVLRLLPWSMPVAAWLGIHGLLAVGVAAWWGLGPWWRAALFLLPWAAAWQLGIGSPGWLWPALFGGTVLVFGGGVLTRVPLYNSNAAAWQALSALLPSDSGVLVDLGAGLGGPLAHLAKAHPRWTFRGVESSLAVWGIARLRTAGLMNCRVRLGSLWGEDLSGCSVAYAFLSPAPMEELWAKVQREMAPGSLFISHTFEVPGQMPERVIPLPGRPGACLRVYRT